MEYTLKKQANAMGYSGYVVYDMQKLPQKYTWRIDDDLIHITYGQAPVQFLTKMMVPGFGGAYLFADNCAKGYTPADCPIDFDYEAAKSRLFHLEAYCAQTASEFGFIPAETRERIETAKALLTDTPRSEQTSLRALCELLWAGEAVVLFRARNTIAKNGVRKDFLLSCSTKGLTDADQTFKNQFSALFNAVCVPTHWGVLEPNRGETHYDVLREMMIWCKNHRMNIRMHALVWFCNLWERQSWQYDLPYDEIYRLCLERVEYLMREFGDYINWVDFNEPMQADGLGMTFDQHFAIVRAAYDIVKRVKPDCQVMINFYDEWQEQYSLCGNQDRSDHQFNGRGVSENEWSVTVYDYVDRCLASGMQIDALGFQFHDHPYDLFGTYELVQQWYGRYHLPIQVTEPEVPSGVGRPLTRIGTRPIAPPDLYWHRPWDEETQAEWFEKFFLLFYSMKEVTAFGAFAFCEAPTQWATYVEGKGIAEMFKVNAVAYSCLLDENFRAKPAYARLRRLADELGIERPGAYDSDTTGVRP